MVVGALLAHAAGEGDWAAGMSGFRFDEGEVRERASRLLLHNPPTSYRRGDGDLNPDLDLAAKANTAQPAAVLVPIVAHEPEVTIMLTLRTAHLPAHAGQVAFPGGKLDRTDKDAVAAALREAEEETGLPASHVDPLGFLDGYLTGTNFRVTPVVGMVKPGFEIRPAADEVEAVFEVPMRFLMTPENHLVHAREWQGKIRHFYAMPFGGRYIWGATAGMLKSLYDRLYARSGTA
jgi:8-oxo-dGTP pyrophosphatase MutT (NUDIX family)